VLDEEEASVGGRVRVHEERQLREDGELDILWSKDEVVVGAVRCDGSGEEAVAGGVDATGRLFASVGSVRVGVGVVRRRGRVKRGRERAAKYGRVVGNVAGFVKERGRGLLWAKNGLREGLCGGSWGGMNSCWHVALLGCCGLWAGGGWTGGVICSIEERTASTTDYEISEDMKKDCPS